MCWAYKNGDSQLKKQKSRNGFCWLGYKGLTWGHKLEHDTGIIFGYLISP